MTTLRQDAECLVETLGRIVLALEEFDGDDRRDYAKELATRLRPLVVSFDQAVRSEKSRSSASGILAEVAPIMQEVSGAATKGDMDIFHDDTLDRYWDLSTIFRESRFREQGL